MPTDPIWRRALVAGIGLILIVASLIVAFNDPFGFWHWLLLIPAGVCLWLVRRI